MVDKITTLDTGNRSTLAAWLSNGASNLGLSRKALLVLLVHGLVLPTTSTAFSQASIRQINPNSAAFIRQAPDTRGTGYVRQLSPRAREVRRKSRKSSTPQRSFRDLLVVGQPKKPAIVSQKKTAAKTQKKAAPVRIRALPAVHRGVTASLAPTGQTAKLPSVGRGLQNKVSK